MWGMEDLLSLSGKILKRHGRTGRNGNRERPTERRNTKAVLHPNKHVTENKKRLPLVTEGGVGEQRGEGNSNSN